MSIQIPYGHGFLSMEPPEGKSYEVLNSNAAAMGSELSGEELVRQAMAAPIGSPTLKELAKGKKTAVIIISDHTRPVPSKEILPPMLEELREGNPEIDVTLLVATGCHRLTTTEEIERKIGPELAAKEKIKVHDCESPDNIQIGILPSGAPLVIDKTAVDADLVVAEGFIEPHFFAGFSGGRKSILPGICDRATVFGNHCSAFISDPHSRTGVLEGNPIHRDMVAAVRMANLQYIVNVILDPAHKTVAAFAGDPVEAHLKGCETLRNYCGVKPQRKGDIIVTSNGGEPLDQNIYQAVKSMTAGEAAAAPGGVIVLCSKCADGTGSDDFYAAMRDCKDAASFLKEIEQIPQDKTIRDQWQYQVLCRVLANHRVIFVTDPQWESIVREMKMDYAPTVQAGLEMAYADRGPDAHLVVIPDGISVIVDGQ